MSQATRQTSEVATFLRGVHKLKKDLDWAKSHQPRELLLGLVEELGEFRNLIKFEDDHRVVWRRLHGKRERRGNASRDGDPVSPQQIRLLYQLAARHGRVDRDGNLDATTFLTARSGGSHPSVLTVGTAEELKMMLIREEVEDFFGDVMWYVGSLADYCNVDLGKAMKEILQKHRARFPRSRVRGQSASILAGGFDGKYLPTRAGAKHRSSPHHE